MKTKIIILLALLITLNTCKDTINNPPEPEPGRRDYVWTVDTIKIPYTFLQNISGSSSQDVWAVGPGGGLDQTIWHFNGTAWETDGLSRGISPLSVFAFSKNNVWLGGREGFIWNYDGISWKENFRYKKKNWDIGFQSIWGQYYNEVYAVGYADSADSREGIILRYSGSTWYEVNIQSLPYNFLRIRGHDSETSNYYLYGSGLTDTDALFEFDGDKINTIYEGKYNPSTWSIVQKIGDEVFFVTGNKICRYINKQLIPITQINDPMFRCQIFGRNKNDIILSMLDGIAHFNGKDIQYLLSFPFRALSLMDGVIFEKDVFLLAIDFEKNQNLIFHGQLIN